MLASSLLYIFWFLHQTTTLVAPYLLLPSCISFDSYIKPQPKKLLTGSLRVVYLLIPTSNHNYDGKLLVLLALYIFWFLHQTTTTTGSPACLNSCISFDSYIKPQLASGCSHIDERCISFDSYIKPQLNERGCQLRKVVYLLIPTSNHNYIQQLSVVCRVVYLLIPTSNHNCWSSKHDCKELYIFWFLHQTTTFRMKVSENWVLYIFWFLHQTTTPRVVKKRLLRLYIFWFLHQTTTRFTALIE